jgi:hypothetical protein
MNELREIDVPAEDAGRLRRRLQATAQAVIEAGEAVWQFETRTRDQAARELCAAMLDHQIAKLTKARARLLAPAEAPKLS